MMKYYGFINSGDERSGMVSAQGRRHGGFFLIPAGALIGLGLGILVGYMWTGLLIGLGGGFLIFVTDKPAGAPDENGPGQPTKPGASLVLLLIAGTYIMVSGIAIVLVPKSVWPDIVAGFLLLLGVWFIVRGFARGGRYS
jgi:hypothetical protein